MAASDGQTYSVGDPVMFQCDPGFSPADTMTAVCTVGGVWSPDLGSFICSESQGTLGTHLHQLLLIGISVLNCLIATNNIIQHALININRSSLSGTSSCILIETLSSDKPNTMWEVGTECTQPYIGF